MVKFADRVKVAIAQNSGSWPSTGTVYLGSAAAGFQSVPTSLDGETIRYVIEHGTDWEIGSGTFNNSAQTVSRSLASSSTGSLLDIDSAANIFISPSADDLQYVEVYSSTSDLPLASSNHGRLVHIHNDGAMYFAHGGNWVRLGNHSDITSYTLPTASSSTLGGIKIGSGLSIDGSGVVTASGSSGSATVNYSPAFVGARWKFTSTQSGLTGGVLTNYTTRDYDTTANNDFTSTNSRLTVPAGVSRVVVKASAETSSVTSQTALKITMNGGDVETTNIDIDSSGGDYVFASTPVIEVTQGDYFEASLFSSNSRSVYVDDRFTWFEIQVIEGSILNSVPQTVQPYDANLKSFTDTFTLPTSDGSANQVLKTDGSGAISFADQSGGIALTDLSVTQNSASGTGALSYNNSSGVFSYTPPASSGSGAADATNYSVTSYTASAGSNTFNASSTPALPAYQAGKLAVYVNGVLQPTSGYTATNGTSVVMTLAANDEVSIVNHGASSGGVTTGKAIAMAIVFGG